MQSVSPARHARRPHAFTLIEILVAVAILAILMGLIFRPLLMGVEVLSIGRAERQAQSTAQAVMTRLGSDLQSAVKVYSNCEAFDLTTLTAGSRWHTEAPERLSFVPAARDAAGNLLNPIQPAVSPVTGQPQVVTYWVMRSDVTQAYDPLNNPRRLWRAVTYYSPYVDTTFTPNLTVTSPDDVYAYAVEKSDKAGAGLGVFGAVAYPLLFNQGMAFDWDVANVDKTMNPAPGSASGQIMRSPFAQAAGANGQLSAPDAYTHSSQVVALSPVTDSGCDVYSVQFLPHRNDNEQLNVNGSYTAYKGVAQRWQPPYQNSSGIWTLPSTGIINAGSVIGANSNGLPPLVGMLRCPGARDAAGLCNPEYFFTVDGNSGDLREGHVILCSMPAADGGAANPVYDCSDYPKRVFGCTPGTAPSSPDTPGSLSGEMAAGIDWLNGQVLVNFPQEDLICPDGTGANPAVIATSNFDWQLLPLITQTQPAWLIDDQAAVPACFAAGSNAPVQPWQALPLTQTGAPGANGYVIDDHYPTTLLSGAAGHMWTSYTLSAFRPERLQTGGLAGQPLSVMQLNMSVVPNSVKVIVEKCDQQNLQNVVVSRAYQACQSSVPGVADGLAPNRYYLDPTTGRLTFYDPQLSSDATTARDGFNPPTDDPTETVNGTKVHTIIRVDYEYRNNLPTMNQIMLSNTANADVAQMTYRTLNAIDFTLTLDVSADSTRGSSETLVDPENAAAAPITRPTGSRRRVSLNQRLVVGTSH